ncbi:MAG: hypothetical protein J3Q66DRAFT_196721 [Benniella sp.]|nr:MAG: hypothetical protein J3Q66DRAFT_196721 [Benniella sp.]
MKRLTSTWLMRIQVQSICFELLHASFLFNCFSLSLSQFSFSLSFSLGLSFSFLSFNLTTLLLFRYIELHHTCSDLFTGDLFNCFSLSFNLRIPLLSCFTLVQISSIEIPSIEIPSIAFLSLSLSLSLSDLFN